MVNLAVAARWGSVGSGSEGEERKRWCKFQWIIVWIGGQVVLCSSKLVADMIRRGIQMFVNYVDISAFLWDLEWIATSR